MNDAEALALVQRACAAAGSSTEPALAALLSGGGPTSARTRQIQRLWGGMGAVFSVTAQAADGASAELVAKRVAEWLAVVRGPAQAGQLRVRVAL